MYQSSSYPSQATLNKVLVWSLTLLAVMALLAFPELTFAQESSEAGYWGGGAADIADRSDRSFRDWWEVGSTWLLWIGLGILVASVVFFKGAGWWIALFVWAIAAWGDKAVDWVSSL